MQHLLLLASLIGVLQASAVEINATGDPQVVWAAVDTLHKCGIIDVPDVPARVFQDTEGVTHMIEGSTKFHWMTGPNPLNLTRNCTMAMNETGDPNPGTILYCECYSRHCVSG